MIRSIHKIPGCPFTVQYSVCIQQPGGADLPGQGAAARPAGFSGRAAERGLMAASMGSYSKDGGGGRCFYGWCLSFPYKGAPVQKHLLAVPSERLTRDVFYSENVEVFFPSRNPDSKIRE